MAIDRLVNQVLNQITRQVTRTVINKGMSAAGDLAQKGMSSTVERAKARKATKDMPMDDDPQTLDDLTPEELEAIRKMRGGK